MPDETKPERTDWKGLAQSRLVTLESLQNIVSDIEAENKRLREIVYALRAKLIEICDELGGK